ncbi:TetR/AcrR family transcriptional regulator [Spiractinospora alimapuensis]|uniref:TetR/AcrR family transcriptional regulator n=1 Tax=Spiractinospora alimapuensis TaxID=2820884 RepID=UPI001F2BC38F|nr:TetR/AcrR family transcriptional regulator [Spiractinospora alimapuensis]QVQ50426.1 TetR/AcrR family transcriptional regulator [Spiractinospora alimapuensis]
MTGHAPGNALPSRRQRQQRRKRAALLTAAKEIFQRQGLAGATISGITERADVAHGTFYSYFSGKDEIFTEIVTVVLDDLLACLHDIGEAHSAKERLLAGIGRLYERCAREREIVLALHQASQLRTQFVITWESFRTRLRELVAQDLGWLSRNGFIRPLQNDLVPTVIARMVEGVVLEIVGRPDADVEALTVTTVQLYYDAVFRPATGEDDIMLE